MRKKGFILIYILPIFLSLIIISAEVLERVTISYKTVNNFIGREKAEYISEIGLKHGLRLSERELSSKEYNISLINNNLNVFDYDSEVNNEYAKVSIKVESMHKSTKVSINSVGSVQKYKHESNYEYIIIHEDDEEDIDNTVENLDT